MRTILLSISVICFAFTINAQNTNTTKLLKLANTEYGQLRYAYAIPLYKAYLKEKPNDTAAIVKLAHSYKINNQYDSALKYFTSANEKGLSVGNNIAELNASNGSYANAVNAYSKLSVNTIAFSKLFQTNSLQTTSSFARIKWAEKTAAMALSDLTSVTSNDNTTISRKYDFNNVSYNANGVSYFDEALNSKYNAGAICFTSDNNTAYFTRNQVKSNGLFALEIWSTTKVEGKWANFAKLSFNTANASYAHPAITKDGKRLYFISDVASGFGGTDLYFVEKDAQGNWGNPINAGDKVNTSLNEMYPTISEGNLYISSNGHVGMGGLDIYKVVMTNGYLTGVLNMAYPLNSNGDDMSFNKNDKKGYLVSNRYGTDDIFSYDFELAKITLNGKVTISDASNNGPITINLYPTSEVSSFSKTYIVPVNESKEKSQTIQASADGSYAIQVRPNRSYKIEAIEPKGNKATMTVNSNAYTANAKGALEKGISALVINIPPPPPPVVETKVSFNNIIDSLKALTGDFVILHHDFDKVTLEKSHNAI